MPNLPLQSEYERIVKNSERLFKQVNRANQAEYAALLKDVRMEVADVYAKYAKSGVLTYAEMQKYDRIKKLKSAIDGIVKERFSTIKAQTQQTLTKNAEVSYAASAEAISTATDVAISTKISADAVTEILKKPSEGWTYAERMAIRQRDLSVRLQGTVTNGFVHGDTLQDASKAIKATVEKDFVRFRSFAGDLNHKVSQDAVRKSQNDAGEEADIMVVSTWVTAGDSNVREAHRLLDGQTVRGDQKFVIPSGEFKGYSADGPGGFGEPALDYGCRCIQVADVVKRES